MGKQVETKLPKVELATQDWTLKELMDTERRIEKAFHEQTQFLSKRLTAQTRWTIGLMVTMTIAIIVAVLFKG